MGDRVRHTARLQCRDQRRYQRKPRKMVKTSAALRQGLKAALDPAHRPHHDVDEEPRHGNWDKGRHCCKGPVTSYSHSVFLIERGTALVVVVVWLRNAPLVMRDGDSTGLLYGYVVPPHPPHPPPQH